MKIYLYVKTHKKTGLKYFGKTTRKDVHNYSGSGLRWKRHLEKHGHDYNTEIIGEFDNEFDCKKIALKYSIENDIVKSKKWANLILEDGMNGWPTGENNPVHFMSKEQNLKKGWGKGKKRPDHSKKMTGENNPRYGKNDHTAGIVKYSKNNIGKSYEEIFGEEKAKEIKAKLSDMKKGIKYDYKKVICPRCGLEGSGPNMSRYHFDNCKKDFSIKKDKRKEEFTCPHCGKKGQNIGNMKRWHFDNCKQCKNSVD